MPMQLPNNHGLKRVTKEIKLNNNLFNDERLWMIWWYCGILKNQKNNSQPNVLLACRKLYNKSLSKIYFTRINLTELGFAKIGSIWMNNMCHSEVIFDTKIFSVDFSKNGWKINSFYEAYQNNTQLPYPMDIYPQKYIQDKNYFIEFSLENGGKLVIPCLEFFSRCYGRSAELKRILATYQWNEEDNNHNNRLYRPINEPEEPGKWKINRGQNLYKGDTVFLAHAKYDNYSKNAAKKIHSQIEAQYQNLPGNNYPMFIKVAPWFKGPAKIKVRGIFFNNGKSFLGLQVTGCSNPDGVPILRINEGKNKSEENTLMSGYNESRSIIPNREISKHPDIINLTDDDEPDQSGSIVEIIDQEFEILGKQRVIFDVKRDGKQGSQKNNINRTESKTCSSTEPFGNDKGIKYASIYSLQLMESHGILHDMWNGFQYLEKKRPELFKAVEWFTFESGYSSSPVPHLIKLQPFDKDDDVPIDIRNWPYMDARTKNELRGVLVIRVLYEDNIVYIIETQRRVHKKKDETGQIINAEQSLKGFILILEDQKKFVIWLRRFLFQIRYVKGIVSKLVGYCPGKAASFKHPPDKGKEFLCESSINNAFDKVGLSSFK